MRFSKDVLALNPDLRAETRRASQKHEDVADVLYAELCRHAKDLWLNAQRDRPFETFRIDVAFPARMLAIEVDGGQHAAGGGKHGSARDYQKTRRVDRPVARTGLRERWEVVELGAAFTDDASARAWLERQGERVKQLELWRDAA